MGEYSTVASMFFILGLLASMTYLGMAEDLSESIEGVEDLERFEDPELQLSLIDYVEIQNAQVIQFEDKDADFNDFDTAITIDDTDQEESYVIYDVSGLPEVILIGTQCKVQFFDSPQIELSLLDTQGEETDGRQWCSGSVQREFNLDIGEANYLRIDFVDENSYLYDIKLPEERGSIQQLLMIFRSFFEMQTVYQIVFYLFIFPLIGLSLYIIVQNIIELVPF